MSVLVGWFALNDQLHSYSLKGWLLERVAGTRAYDDVYLFKAAFALITCLLVFVLIAFTSVSESIAKLRKVARKRRRRAAWEAEQALAAKKGASDP